MIYNYLNEIVHSYLNRRSRIKLFDIKLRKLSFPFLPVIIKFKEVNQ